MQAENGHMHMSSKQPVWVCVHVRVNGKTYVGKEFLFIAPGKAISSELMSNLMTAAKTPLTGGNGKNPLKAETTAGHIYMSIMAQSTSPLLLRFDNGRSKT